MLKLNKYFHLILLMRFRRKNRFNVKIARHQAICYGIKTLSAMLQL